MFCSQCGNRLPPNTKYCPHCGVAVYVTEPTNKQVPKRRLLLWLCFILLPCIIILVISFSTRIMHRFVSSVNTVPIEYGPRITEEYVSAAEEDKTLHEAIQHAIAFFDKNNVVLKLVQINPQTPEVTAQGLHANVIFYVDCIYLENDSDEQNLLNDTTIIYNELTNCFLRSKNLNYHPWIVLVVHHPTKGWGLTIFAPTEYTPYFIYGNYTEDTLPYPYK